MRVKLIDEHARSTTVEVTKVKILPDQLEITLPDGTVIWGTHLRGVWHLDAFDECIAVEVLP